MTVSFPKKAFLAFLSLLPMAAQSSTSMQVAFNAGCGYEASAYSGLLPGPRTDLRTPSGNRKIDIARARAEAAKAEHQATQERIAVKKSKPCKDDSLRRSF